LGGFEWVRTPNNSEITQHIHFVRGDWWYTTKNYHNTVLEGTPVELSPETVKNIAELARLDLSNEEVERYTQQLSTILGYFQRLQTLDTDHIALTDSVLPLKNVLRPDIAQPALNPEDAVANAPDAEDNQFRVSAVLGED
jgi:aspartyl-tRNA(Asn)/glutamyl-tRNA(Gln) amidotransferase subunit C